MGRGEAGTMTGGWDDRGGNIKAFELEGSEIAMRKQMEDSLDDMMREISRLPGHQRLMREMSRG
jgi:hypothetical protein